MENQNKLFKCKKCSIEIDSSYIKFHQKLCKKQNNNNSEILILKTINEKEEKKKITTCQICSQQMTVKQYESHFNQCEQNSKPCEYCGQRLSNQIMQNHLDQCEAKDSFIKQFQNPLNFQANDLQQNLNQVSSQNQNSNQIAPERLSLLNNLMYLSQALNYDKDNVQLQQQYQSILVNIQVQNALELQQHQQGIQQQAVQPSNNNVLGPLNQNQIDQFPIISFLLQQNVSEDETKCTICYSQFEENEQIKFLVCMHKFHMECIDSWLKKSSLCPVCKKDMKLYV